MKTSFSTLKRTMTAVMMLSLFATSSWAQITNVSCSKNDCSIYGRTDITVSLNGKWTNPFRQEEARLDAIVITPSGKTMQLPGFYVSGDAGSESTWSVRFTPKEAGRHQCVVRYEEPGMESMSQPVYIDVAGTKVGHGMLHTNDMWTLRHDDGTLFRGIGENICWESRDVDDSRFFKQLHEQHERFNYPVMIPKFAGNGGNFIRIWMCSWNFPIDRKADFNNSRYQPATMPMNESAAKRLDETVELCEREGVSVMLCMGAGEAETDAAFFTDTKAKAEYRNRLRYIVARWGYSTAIAMWEFFNEIDNIQFKDNDNPIPATDIVGWHADMSRYLKSIDPYGHIVTTSISHRDLDGLNDVADIDINQKHIYRNTSDIPQMLAAYTTKHGKPYIVGEFGYEWDWSKNFNDFADGMDADFRRGLWYGLFCPTPVTPMSWWWEYFDERKMERYFRAPAMVSRMMIDEGKGQFASVEAKAGNGHAYAVRCGGKTFVYVFNPAKAAITSVTVSAKGKMSELNINSLKWSKPSACNGTIKTRIKPNSERLFVIE